MMTTVFSRWTQVTVDTNVCVLWTCPSPERRKKMVFGLKVSIFTLSFRSPKEWTPMDMDTMKGWRLIDHFPFMAMAMECAFVRWPSFWYNWQLHSFCSNSCSSCNCSWLMIVTMAINNVSLSMSQMALTLTFNVSMKVAKSLKVQNFQVFENFWNESSSRRWVMNSCWWH